MDIQKYLCPETMPLRGIMERLNTGLGGITVLVDEDNIVRGILTDGDIRRALLIGLSLETPARQCMNRDFFSLPVGMAPSEYLRHLNRRIQHLPVLDEAGRLREMILFKEQAILPVSSPCLLGNELRYLTECITSNWISSQGAFVKKFEEAFSQFYGGIPSLTTSNGTTALHLAMLGCGLGPGDEVIVPDSTFAATASTVIHAGATPVFVDVLPDTWCMDPEQVRRCITPRTKAIVPVHLYGHPADMDALCRIAEEHNLLVIEDCAESLGARLNGRLTGTFGHVACFSFFSNKVITTGEGGMVMTTDPDMLEKMRRLRDHGMTPGRRYWHETPGFNYRLTNMQAAIGLAQMERLEHFLALRASTAALYEERLQGIPGVQLPPHGHDILNIFWLYTVVLNPEEFGMERDEFMLKLRERHIETRPFFPALHHQPAFSAMVPEGRTFPNSLALERHGVSLPTGNTVTLPMVEEVCDAIEALAAQNRRHSA